MIVFQFTFRSEDDKNKFTELFQRYNKLLYYFAMDILHNHADAEDAVQVTYIKIFHNLDKIEETNERKTVNYIVTILKNVAFNIYNKNKEFANHMKNDTNELFIQSSNQLSFENLHFENFKTIIESLDEKYQIPLLLMYVYGFSIIEIAEIMDISESNAGTRIYRAKLKIKDLLYEAR